ncbi:primase [Rhodobacter phage RcNL1]|nr:primase [Rhodobacter phage RcNL1]
MAGASAAPGEDAGGWNGFEPDFGPPTGSDGPAPPVGGDGDGGDDDGAVRECAEFELNDFGNGKRFVRHFGHNLRFVAKRGWHVWDDMRWSKDDEIARDVSPRVRGMAQQIGPLIEREIAWLVPTPREADVLAREARLLKREAELERMDEADRPEDWSDQIAAVRSQLRALEAQLKGFKTKIGRRITHAKNAGNSGPLTNMVGEARVMLAVPHEAMDADPLEINTLAGVLRFRVDEEDGRKYCQYELVPHDRAQMLTSLMPVAYDPEAQCPQFHLFLHRIQPKAEMRAFLARWLGFGMTALQWEQKIAFWYGSGANGKSVLSDLIARILGDYAATARIESLTGTNKRSGSDATPDLIPLIPARTVRTSEPDEGMRLQEGMVKQLTGGEKILVRPNYGEFIEVDPQFKINIQGNHKPDIRATDDGIWRRVMLIPFDVQIPPEERDAKLGAKLWEERSGILNWLIGGLCDYLENGLQEPQSVLDATLEYREESDPIGQFLTDCCVVTGDAQDSLEATQLRDAFMFWQMGQAVTMWTDSTISKRLAEKSRRYRGPGGATFSIRKSNGVKRYDGIKLTDAFGRRLFEAPRDHRGRILSASPAAEA